MNYVHDVFARAGGWLGDRFRAAHEPDLTGVDGVESIEFYGGPLDGMCWQVKTSAVYQLPPALELPLGGDAAEWLPSADPLEIPRRIGSAKTSRGTTHAFGIGPHDRQDGARYRGSIRAAAEDSLDNPWAVS